MYIPDDPRLRSHAFAIAEQRRHSLRRDDTDGAGDPAALDEPPSQVAESEPQLSLFQAISAVAVDDEPAFGDMEGSLFAPVREDIADDDADLLIELAPPPPLAGLGDLAGDDGTPVRPRERRRALRESNAALARQIARITGLSHSQVNHELNRRVGVGRVGEATLDQLERRREHASRWLAVA